MRLLGTCKNIPEVINSRNKFDINKQSSYISLFFVFVLSVYYYFSLRKKPYTDRKLNAIYRKSVILSIVNLLIGTFIRNDEYQYRLSYRLQFYFIKYSRICTKVWIKVYVTV